MATACKTGFFLWVTSEVILSLFCTSRIICKLTWNKKYGYIFQKVSIYLDIGVALPKLLVKSFMVQGSIICMIWIYSDCFL